MIKAGGKRPQMPGSPGHLRTFSQNRLRFVSAGHMSTEQGKAALRPPRDGRECVEHSGSAKARSNACFNHACMRAIAHGHKYKKKVTS